eukprot:gb/GECH01009028.1/.p1 GENE.gb/GECH01009028.1/~~gb/GECH01009028.1/.p1  ORF type:complete len:276 (+),score=62.38 gb/GECH01009028.1/:1-828(+)
MTENKITNTPCIFLSHGSPTLYWDKSVAAHNVFASLIPSHVLNTLKAVVVISAHWETHRHVSVNSNSHPETIHDFYGFPSHMYAFQYPAPGHPQVAGRVQSLLEDNGVTCHLDAHHGIDHGTWVPMHLIAPAADVPVVQLSLNQELDPKYHYRIGEALSPLLDENVMILSSGGLTHNLGEVKLNQTSNSNNENWATKFEQWVDQCLSISDPQERAHQLQQWRTAPFAERAHPREEHLIPFFVALGAGTRSQRNSIKVHEEMVFNNTLSMGSYAFV